MLKLYFQYFVCFNFLLFSPLLSAPQYKTLSSDIKNDTKKKLKVFRNALRFFSVPCFSVLDLIETKITIKKVIVGGGVHARQIDFKKIPAQSKFQKENSN